MYYFVYLNFFRTAKLLKNTCLVTHEFSIEEDFLACFSPDFLACFKKLFDDVTSPS
jgi:hypothetical protein